MWFDNCRNDWVHFACSLWNHRSQKKNTFKSKVAVFNQKVFLKFFFFTWIDLISVLILFIYCKIAATLMSRFSSLLLYCTWMNKRGVLHLCSGTVLHRFRFKCFLRRILTSCPGLVLYSWFECIYAVFSRFSPVLYSEQVLDLGLIVSMQ